VPGAAVQLRRSWAWGGEHGVELGCASASADDWVPGLEGLVLGAATDAAVGQAGLGSVRALELHRAPTHFEQAFDGQVGAGPSAALAQGRHVLGFAGEPQQVLLCTVVCTQPAEADAAGAEGRCAEVTASLEVGPLGEAPQPGIFAKAALLAAGHPTWVLAALFAVALVAVGWLLQRRPRPPRRLDGEPPR